MKGFLTADKPLPSSVQLYHGDCLEVIRGMKDKSVDAVVTDPPYSNRTHRDHDASVNGHKGKGGDGSARSPLVYTSWSKETATEVGKELCRVCSGWIVIMTDHILARTWERVQLDLGRYVFAPLPWFVPGSRVRLSGDGPSSWTVWIVVSRTAEQVRWGTLPGGYTQKGDQALTGGKPVELMRALVRDYSHSDQTVLDPCMGSGTTGVACVQTGRNFIGIEIDPDYFKIAERRIKGAPRRAK